MTNDTQRQTAHNDKGNAITKGTQLQIKQNENKISNTQVLKTHIIVAARNEAVL